MLDSQMCRTCLREDDQDEISFVHIFDENHQITGELIGDILNYCLKINVSTTFFDMFVKSHKKFVCRCPSMIKNLAQYVILVILNS
jgi:hypothetical protein